MPKEDIPVIRIALAGQPNVGKSVIFNKLTGLNQTVGNWPGKTVSKAEGYTIFKGYRFEIIDLPGIYSLSSYSLEEIIARDYILKEKPDYIVNVVNCNHLERNLFLTLQLLLLERPLVLVLNQYDVLQEQGYEINVEKLEKFLNVPAIRTVAVKGKGVHELLELIIDLHRRNKSYEKTKNDAREGEAETVFGVEGGEMKHGPVDVIDVSKKTKLGKIRDWERDFHREWEDVKVDPFITDKPYRIKFGKEVEIEIERIIDAFKDLDIIDDVNIPERYTAQKVLENDEYILEHVKKILLKKYPEDGEKKAAGLFALIKECRERLEQIHGHDVSEIFNQEYYYQTARIAMDVIVEVGQRKENKIRKFFEDVTVHPFWGIIMAVLILFGTYTLIFMLGNLISGLFDDLYNALTEKVLLSWSEDSLKYKIVWDAMVGGLFAGVGGVLPYVIPFYLVIEILQDTGYLPRAAYIMDRFMHMLGLHGKAIIPVLLGFGCNVPAITATMIMDNEREKRRAVVIASMVPCSAVSVIVLGLVGKYMGLQWALLLYIINFVVMVIVGKVMKKIDPVKEDDLIIEFHDFRKPNFGVIFKQTWFRSKEFVYMALPLIVVMGIILQLMMEFNLLDPLNTFFKPITVDYLGLPVGVSVFLLYGILRKELNLVLLQGYVLSLGLTMTEYMTPIQMITFSLMTMLYVPCIATIIVIKHHTSTKFAVEVFFILLLIALIISGIVRWGYELVVFLMNL